ncbi:MAG TPA: HAMP domain-containing sensor histidine kinase [Daejeonella sp.]|nr:HAMP domain-containing sensor histidine kinase [Daejeonella sp.]
MMHCYATFIGMKRHLTLILISMSLCVTGIIGLQFFWNYQNYKATIKAFNYDINSALNTAVNREIDLRHQKIIKKFKQWMADTTIVQISCNNNNRDSATVFNIKDTYSNVGEEGASVGFKNFKQKLKTITPGAKKFMINEFGDKILKEDLKKGIVYYYTQRLGDSLYKAFDQSKLNVADLNQLYKEELVSRGISETFKLSQGKSDHSNLYLTKQVNAALRRPYEKELISAAFNSPDFYFLQEMKWLIITSFLLVGITIFCFAYTVKTLLSQHRLSELKDDFINNMNHEINTPISSITITVEALKSFDYDDQTRKEYLGIIGHQTNKLTELAGKILSLNKLGKTAPGNYSCIELNSLIRRAIHDVSPLVKSNNANIKYIDHPQSLYIQAEEMAIINAFTNIIENAVKYNDNEASIEIVLLSSSKFAEISFIDNGIGIPEEFHDKVFDKFFRIPRGNTHNVKGYGLGLNFVKQVIQQHKGAVSLTANNPSGSIFTIKLPLV